ncbi:hypothetical protein E0L29_11320 [Chlorobium sp. N1]|nr:hypothetical protein E0L29_11320 [Chlorobium sp. N1]
MKIFTFWVVLFSMEMSSLPIPTQHFTPTDEGFFYCKSISSGVGNDALAELVLIPVLGAMNPLGFRGLEKYFGSRIIVTVTLAAHTLNHPVFFPELCH